MTAEGATDTQDINCFQDTGLTRAVFSVYEVHLLGRRNINRAEIAQMLDKETLQGHKKVSLMRRGKK